MLLRLGLVDHEQLRLSPIGQLVPISGNDARYGPYACFAYLPEPLPRESLEIDLDTLGSLTKATSALARLDQACTHLPDPGLLIRPPVSGGVGHVGP